MELGKIALVVGLGLAGCSTPVVPQPPNPEIVGRIAQVCLGSGLFKTVVGIGNQVVLGPVGALPTNIVSAGVDQVCSDPARFAGDISTVEWVVKNLKKQK